MNWLKIEFQKIRKNQFFEDRFNRLLIRKKSGLLILCNFSLKYFSIYSLIHTSDKNASNWVFSLVWMIKTLFAVMKMPTPPLRLNLINFSAFNAKRSGWVHMCKWQRACMWLILITFLITCYKKITDNMFISVANENGAVWMNSL